MRDTISTVGDLSGKHVGIDTVRIEHRGSVIEGVITALTFTADHQWTVNGARVYINAITANISIGPEFELNNLPLDTPASIVTRSDPQ